VENKSLNINGNCICYLGDKQRNFRPTPVAARSKAWVCGRALAGIVGSKPTEGMVVCLLYSVCVVR
jgi:hypothetical protein